MTDTRTSPSVALSRWSWAGGHEKGGRSYDQDNCAVPDKGDPRVATHGALLVLCDGVGGDHGGEVASETAVAVAIARYYAADASLPRKQALTAMVAEAQAEICRRAEADAALSNMGTTLVAVVVTPSGQIYTAHAGDSRAYQFHDGQLDQLTQDHSLVQAQGMSGTEARASGFKNIITKSLGPGGDSTPDIHLHGDLQPGARIVLCSDGVHGAVAKDEIRRILMRAPTAAAAQRALLDAALRNRTTDNISAIVFDYGRPAIRFIPGLLAHPAARPVAMAAAAIAAFAALALVASALLSRTPAAQPGAVRATAPPAGSGVAPAATGGVVTGGGLASGGGLSGTQGGPGAGATPGSGAIGRPTATLDLGAPPATATLEPGKAAPVTTMTPKPVATSGASGTKAEYPAPEPLGPEAGRRFEANETPELRWTSVGALQPNDYYRVLIKYKPGYDSICVKETSAKPNAYVRSEGAPEDTFTWTVDVVRALAPPKADSHACDGAVVSVGASRSSSFKWAAGTQQQGGPSSAPSCASGLTWNPDLNRCQ